MEAFPPFLLIVAVVGLVLGIVLTLLTRMSVLAAASWCIGLLFVLGWIGWFSVELALIGALVAALPTLAGANVGKRIRRRWGS